ncbi:MAG: PQ-loop repeat-containing protein [Proteobacteria bacterium]|nr:PQ-loop repeat-containing protein [Pseudomonadota bacterium]
MNYIDTIGIIASVTSVVGFLPQIYKNQQTKSVQDLSAWMLLNFLVCSLAWMIYGSLTDSFYVLLTNVACLCASGFLMGQKMYFQR